MKRARKVAKKNFHVTLGSGRRPVASFSTKKAALEHARFAVKVGASKACVSKTSPTTGTRFELKCVSR